MDSVKCLLIQGHFYTVIKIGKMDKFNRKCKKNNMYIYKVINGNILMYKIFSVMHCITQFLRCLSVIKSVMTTQRMMACEGRLTWTVSTRLAARNGVTTTNVTLKWQQKTNNNKANCIIKTHGKFTHSHTPYNIITSINQNSRKYNH